MKFNIFFLIVLIFAGCRSEEDLSLEKIFFERDAEGGIIISSLDGKEFIYNNDHLETSYSPDSTFFLPTVLIALEDRVVTEEKNFFVWDDEDRGLAEWNKDQTLESAYKYSCVWVHQRLSQQIGISRYVAHLKAMKYGNGRIGSELSSFWTNGELKITARQQLEFLKSLYRETLPVGKIYQQKLKQMMIVKKTNKGTMYSKTAWASNSPTRHGWNIGFIETIEKRTWFFVLNMKIDNASKASFRQEIVLEALKEKGIEI